MGEPTTGGKKPGKTATRGEGNTSGSGIGQQGAPTIGGADGGSVSPDDEDAEEKASGHPVSVLSGAVFDSVTDITLYGLITVQLTRVYRSSLASEQTDLGVGGWTFSLAQRIDRDDRGLRLLTDKGRHSKLPDLSVGQVGFKRAGRLEVQRPSIDTIRLRSLVNGLTEEFSTDSGADISADTPARLRRIYDPHENSIQLRYSGGRLASIVEVGGREIRLRHDAEARVASAEIWVDDQLQEQVDYRYHPTGELAEVRDALGHTDRFEYDGKHRLTRSTLPNGVSFHYEYDGETGACIKTWGDGGLHQYEFVRKSDAKGTLVTTTSANEPCIYEFGAAGDAVSVRSYDGQWEIRNEFDDDHLLLKTSNAAGESTSFEYDDRGNLLSSIDPAGNVTRWEYENDLLVKTITCEGRVERFRYNAFGSLIEIESANGVRTGFEYDRFGRLVGLTGPDGLLATYTYDRHHNIATETKPDGARFETTYDALGRPISWTTPTGDKTLIERDAVGRPTVVRHPDGTRSEKQYDPLGNPIRFVDGKGQVTEVDYVGTGAMSRIRMPDGRVWEFEHDTMERLRTIKNPKGERHQYTYDGQGRPVEERTFDGRRLKYGYDLAGRLRRIDRPDGTYRTFEYDKLGNVVLEDSTHGSQEYERDRIGRVLKATLDEGLTFEVTMARDEGGQIVEERQGAHLVRNGFDVRGRRVERVVPGCGVTQYAYDVRSRLSSLGHTAPNGATQTLEFKRDAMGRPTEISTGDRRIVLSTSYDSMGRIAERKVETPGLAGAAARDILSRRAWTYDPTDAPTFVEDLRWGPSQFTYDRVGQLTNARIGNSHHVFEYQADGSLSRALDAIDVEKSIEGPGHWKFEEGNILVQTDRHTLEYDTCRRRTAKIDRATGDATRYTWDCRDRLREVRFADGSRARYFYDAFGRRVKKERYPAPSNAVDGEPEVEITEFVWDGDQLAAEHSTTSGQRGHVHYPETFIPLLQIEGGQIYVVVTDNVGTVRDLIAPSGTLQWSASYTPWGKIREEFVQDQQDPRGPPVRSPFRLLGQYHDSETGFGATLFRYWDPDLGRWCSPDPLGVLGDPNLSGFNGCPLIEVDPFGLGAGNPDKVCYVYVLRDENGKIVYIGISCNPKARVQAHNRPPKKKDFAQMDVIGGPMTHDQARNLEGGLIRAHVSQAQAAGATAGPTVANTLENAGLQNDNRGRSPENWREGTGSGQPTNPNAGLVNFTNPQTTYDPHGNPVTPAPTHTDPGYDVPTRAGETGS